MLDRSRKISQICPTDEWGGAWVQDGIVFNVQEEFVQNHPDNRGKEVKPQEVKIVASVKIQKDKEATKSAGELIEMAGELKFLAFRHEAKKLLGDDCPKSKQAILNALEKRLPRERVVEDKSGLSWDSISGGSQLNLTAWGQGDKDYIFPDVMSAIQKRYHKTVTNTADAIDFLIDEGVIEAKNARID